MTMNEILEKYPQTNNEWGLHTYNFGNSTSLGKRISWMYNELMMNGRIDVIHNDVIDSINKLDSVTTYFIRNVITRDNFVGDDVYDKLKPYNADPWNREFLVYYGNVLHSQYAHIKNRDGYQKSFVSVYYTNMVSYYSGMHIFNESKVPLMILYSTSVNGLNIYCLDVVKVNQI
jgi:uncharacterized protein (DUF2225 family)